MEWIVVHFIDDNSVEAIPKAWLHDNVCYWLPYTSKRLNQAITKCEEPVLDTWHLYKVRQLGNGRIYDNLLKAKAKALRAEDTSDLASDNDGKRIPKKRRNLYDSDLYDSSESSGDNNVAPVKFPALTESNVCKEAEAEQMILPKDTKKDTNTNKIVSNERHKTSNVCKEAESEQIILPKDTNTSKIVSNEQHKTDVNQNNTSDVEFKKQVLRQLQIINLKQNQMCEDMQTIIGKIVLQNDAQLTDNDKEDSIFEKFDFPLKSISELDALEDFLSNENNFNPLVQELRKIGGGTYKQMVKRIMFKLFSNEVAQGYSWIGFKGKNKFSLLRIAAAIIMAVQKTHTAITLSDIEVAIKAWLVKAKFRNANTSKKHDT